MSLARRLARCENGSPATEFAIICPVLLVVMLGLGDLCFQGYMQNVLTGAVQKAGRDSGLKGADPASIDAKVEATIHAISPGAQFLPVPTRKSYSNYAANAPEPFTDSNGNGKYDKPECFQDINGNGVWDADPGFTGQGGAGDVVVYTVTVQFPRLFPLGSLAGLGNDVTIQASTILKNQPYDNQVTIAVKTICS